MLHKTQLRKEFILIMGAPGAGKSHCWLSIANGIEKTSKGMKEEDIPKMYLYDTDYAWEGQAPPDGKLDHIIRRPKTESGLITNYEESKLWLSDCRLKGKPGDWLIIDMMDLLWTEFVPTQYYEEVYGKDIDDFFIQSRKNNENVGGDWGNNWTAMNTMYNKVFREIKLFPGNVLALTPVAAITESMDSPLKLLYSKVGVRPNGQKGLSYPFMTILLLQDTQNRGRIFTTLKERSSPEQPREMAQNKEMKDFVTSYLIGVAQWKLM